MYQFNEDAGDIQFDYLAWVQDHDIIDVPDEGEIIFD